MSTTTAIEHDRPRSDASPACNRVDAITKSLLGYGAIAGPLYVTVSLAQALSHDGFDLTRNAWSQLGAGPAGWIQIANLVLTGAMLIAFSFGLARTVSGRAAPVLLGVFGAGMVVAGFNPADPGFGYPVGVPAPASPSGHAIAHMASAGVGFFCAVAAMIVMGRTFAKQGRRVLAWSSRTSGVFFLAAFVALATGAGHPALVIAFTIAVIALFGVLAVIAVQQYRRVARAV